MKLNTAASIAMMAASAMASVVHESKRASPLAVELTSVGNTAVKAVLSNNGAEALNLLKTGTILDESKLVEKVQVWGADGKVTFEGIKLRVAVNSLTAENFVTLAAGESKVIDIDVAALHDVTVGGSFDITSVGAVPYAEAGSTELTGSALPIFSNRLTISVDGAEAAKVEKAVDVAKRSVVSSDCTGTKLTATKNALTNCATLAKAAAAAAQTNNAKVTEYFKSTASRSTIVARFNAVATECSSSTSGKTSTHCTDTYSACSSGVLAYTLPSANYVVNCPLYFSALPALTKSCHAQDQATTTLHEMTHAPGVYSPGTQDNGYGYSAATALSASAALNNADSYALFANAIYAGC